MVGELTGCAAPGMFSRQKSVNLPLSGKKDTIPATLAERSGNSLFNRNRLSLPILLSYGKEKCYLELVEERGLQCNFCLLVTWRFGVSAVLAGSGIQEAPGEIYALSSS